MLTSERNSLNSQDNRTGHILVIDDDEMFLQSISLALTNIGYHHDCAVSGDAAIAMLRDNSFDIALIDLNMPNIDGFQLLDTIHRESIPVIPIVLTGMDSVSNAVRAIKLGAFDLLQKPIEYELLIKALEHAMEYRKALVEHEQMRILVEEWRSAFNESPNPVLVLDLNGNITHCNKKIASLVKRDLGQIIGKHCHTIICEQHHPLQACPFLANLTEYSKVSFEIQILNGIYEFTSVPLLDISGNQWGRFIVAHDLTDIRRKEQIIKESEEKFRTITDVVQDAIFMMDENGLLSFYNRAAESIFGWASEEVIGMDLCDLFFPERYRAFYRNLMAEHSHQNNASLSGAINNMTAMRKDGSEFPVELSVSPVFMRGEWHAVGVVRDISEHCRMEQALQQANMELEKRVEERTLELAEMNERLNIEAVERALADDGLRQLNRMLRVRSECNQAIVRIADEMTLLNHVCNILVEYGNYPTAWIGLFTPEDKDTLHVVAQAGFKFKWNNSIPVHNSKREKIPGIVSDSISTRMPQRTEHVGSSKELAAWASAMAEHDDVQYVAIPLVLVNGDIAGVVGISAIEEDSFCTAEVGLLSELANDLGYAISSLRTSSEYRSTQDEIAVLNILKAKLLTAIEQNDKLTLITDTFVDTFHMALARIWNVSFSESCDNTCIFNHSIDTNAIYEHKYCLRLSASSEECNFKNRIFHNHPMGKYTLDGIDPEKENKYLTTLITADSPIQDPQWACDMGLASFAGWLLIAPDGNPVGILEVFSKHPITESQGHLLDDLSNTALHVILAGHATEALRENERKYQKILYNCPFPLFVLDKKHHVISWNKALENFSSISQKEVLGTPNHWRAFYEKQRPVLADLLVDGKMDEIDSLYGAQCSKTPFLEGGYMGTKYLPDEGIWLHYTAVPLWDEKGNITGAIESLEDVTHRKQVEDELHKSRAELERRVEERTKELMQANSALECENELRTLTEDELRKAHGEVERLFDSMSSFLIGLKQDMRITRWNAAAESTFGIPWVEAVGKSIDKCGIRWNWTAITAQIPNWPYIEDTIHLSDVLYTRPNGTDGFLSVTVDPVKNDENEYDGCFLLGMDCSERRNLEGQLVQAQKLEAVGRLAAGIAHEINTPTQYVGDNIEFLQIAYDSITPMINSFPELVKAAESGNISTALRTNASDLIEKTNIEYLTEQIPRAIEQSMEGIDRITSIVQAMKEFSHPGVAEKTSVDLNQCIRSTATVSRNEWKYVADLVLELDNSLPQVLCLPGDFNQTILNMIVNAAHAISDLNGVDSEHKGMIHISTTQDGDWAEVRIADNGGGIPPAIRERIFDPFFTTKEVGRGTGQGLAIARNVIVDKHSGTIKVESEVGKGTTFIIRLPIEGRITVDEVIPTEEIME